MREYELVGSTKKKSRTNNEAEQSSFLLWGTDKKDAGGRDESLSVHSASREADGENVSMWQNNTIFGLIHLVPLSSPYLPVCPFGQATARMGVMGSC